MTRISDILLRARDTLGDQDIERWSDERLLRLVDEGQRDIAQTTKILKGTHVVPLIVGTAQYVLPEDVFLITRASYNGCPISFHTYHQMDEAAAKANTSHYRHHESERRIGNSSSIDYDRTCWEEAEGSRLEAIIYDQQNMSHIRVYPVLSEGAIEEDYQITTIDPQYVGASKLGIVVDMEDYTFNQTEGAVQELFDPAITQDLTSSPYGVVVAIQEYDQQLTIYYIKSTPKVTSIDDELEIPSMFDRAIQNYIVWQGFRDDNDTRNVEKANDAKGEYFRLVGIVNEVEDKNQVRNPQRRTSYRGAFE